MSYRTIKRLFGETSLERKCRLLLGGGIFVLIGLSFLAYGYQTEKLVWDQLERTAQLQVDPILFKRHIGHLLRQPASAERTIIFERLRESFLLEEDIEEILPEKVQDYQARILRPGSDNPRYQPRNPRKWQAETLYQMQEGSLEESTKIISEHQQFYYMSSVRLSQKCLDCHPTALDGELGYTNFAEGDLIAAVSLEFPTSQTELEVNLNRAILLSFAFGTAIIAMLFAYVTVRYVIVKPLTHLKEVSEEIASGNIDIRTNIQTGDEFEELSHAFNRMLRRLVSMQDELRNLNTDLDNKLDQLAQANMALFEMNRLKSDFLATISHELRTPLNSILGFSDLISELPELPTKQKRWTENIRSSGNLLLKLINDILALAKLEAGKMRVHVEEFSLRDVIEGQIQMTRPLADKKNIALSAEVDPAIPILCQDGNKLQQILSNLLSNAIKFTPEGGRINVSCKPDRAHVVISVSDNGVGIAPEDQKLIFDKFRQAQSGLTRDHSGTGLGLSIVRELTKLLGGEKVELESELGRGSTFTIRIPMHFSEQEQMELLLGSESFEPSSGRQTEVRYYTSKQRPVAAD